MRPPRIKYLPVKHEGLVANCPSIDRTGSVTGMRKHFWGENAAVVKCGSYYYKVHESSRAYQLAH